MLELVRVYLGYCSNCRLPKIVGDFRIPGWQHVFPICDSCMQKQTDKLTGQASRMAMDTYGMMMLESTAKGRDDYERQRQEEGEK